MNKGFSLVELIVVIAIMAILVGVAVPVYSSYIGKANNNVDKQFVDEVERAIETLLIDPDVENPTTELTITITVTDGVASYDGDAAFIAKLAEIIPATVLKGDVETADLTFTISGYDCQCNFDSLLEAAAD